MEKTGLKIKRKWFVSSSFLAVITFVFLFAPYELKAQESGWGTYPSISLSQQGQPKKMIPIEIYGSVAFQEGGTLAPSAVRSPMSLRFLLGVNFLKLNISSLGGRILHGPFFSLPFSIEIGYLQDIKEFGPAIGWQFSGRPSKHWKWLFGVQLSWITPDYNLVGPGIQFGGVYYFLAGLGLFAEANIDAYFGGPNVLTAGGSAGIIFDYEFYKPKKVKIEE